MVHLLVAAGGGGDALAALMIDSLVEPGGSQAWTVIASYSWDRFLFDPVPGPRVPADFRGLDPISPLNWEVSGRSQLRRGMSTLPMLASLSEARYVLLNPANGAKGMREQLIELVQAVHATRVTLVDVGGDAIASGAEPGLLSPLADALTVAAIQDLPVPTQVVIAGPGLDGELDERYALDRCGDLSRREPLTLTRTHVEPFFPILQRHPSEATTLWSAAAVGVRGIAEMRDSAAAVTVNADGAKAFVLDADVAYRANRLAQVVATSSTLDEAESAVVEAFGRSELDHERRKAARAPMKDVEVSDVLLLQRFDSYLAESARRGISLLTYRRLTEVLGLTSYDPDRVRRLLGPRAHPDLPLGFVNPS